MRFNNDVTYDKKWDTLKNNAALEKLDKKFFDRSICSPDCPVAWAPEVLELLETLDKKLGIRRNEETIRAYRISGSTLSHMLAPFKRALNEFMCKESYKKEKYSFGKRLLNAKEGFVASAQYTRKVLMVRYANPVINKVLKPNLTLSQIKEKYGSLTVYFSCDEMYEDYVEKLIKKTMIKLAVKGAYYSIESMWDYSTEYHVGNVNHPDTIVVKDGVYSSGEKYIAVERTTYRNLMKEMGLDVATIKYNAEIKKTTKADPE